MSKKLYTVFSISGFIWSLVLRLVCIIAIIYFTTIYNENPPLILFLIIICGIQIFTLGINEIIVYNDRIVQTDNSFSSLLLKSKGQTYLIENIKLAYIPQKPKASANEIGVSLLIMFLLPRRRNEKINSFFIDFKNGETKEIETSLGESKMIELVKDVNTLAKSKSTG